MPLKRARSSDSSKKPSISAKIRCTLTPQGQKNQIKRAKAGEGSKKWIFKSRPRTLISSMSMKMGIYPSRSPSHNSTHTREERGHPTRPRCHRKKEERDGAAVTGRRVVRSRFQK